jgi:hypothetical protein
VSRLQNILQFAGGTITQELKEEIIQKLGGFCVVFARGGTTVFAQRK